MGGAAGQARPHLSSSTASTPQEGPVEEPAVQQTATVQPPASIAKPRKIGEASDVALTEVNTSGASGQAPRHPPNSENSRVTGEEAERELRYERETAGLAGRNEHVFQWMDHAGGPHSPFHSHGVQAYHPGLQTALPSSMVRIQRKWRSRQGGTWGALVRSVTSDIRLQFAGTGGIRAGDGHGLPALLLRNVVVPGAFKGKNTTQQTAQALHRMNGCDPSEADTTGGRG